jgi:hypothetical protein
MLASIVVLMTRMSYPELKDFIDYCEFYQLSKLLVVKERDKFLETVRMRRVGIRSGDLPPGSKKSEGNFLKMSSDTQIQAYELIKVIPNRQLVTIFGVPALDDRDLGSTIAWALLAEKERLRHLLRGNIQIKWLKSKTILKDADGQRLSDENGIPHPPQFPRRPYLYLRYWTVEGDSNKKTSLTRSVCIDEQGENGRSYEDSYLYAPLAKLFWETLEASKKGEEEKRLAETALYKLDRRIMECIDMSHDEPIIDHAALLSLQTELCQNGQDSSSSHQI